jgi:hypothetical protein
MNMQFVNHRQQILNNDNSNLKNMRQFMMLPFKQPSKSNVSTPPVPIILPNTDNASGKKKMPWGEATWFLLHTLSYKLKPEYFNKIKGDLLNNLFTICSNLPCPICATHAKDYIKSSNFFNLNSKEELKQFFFKFHNEINKQKGFALFNYDDFDEKYKYANTLNVIKNFMFYFKDKHHSIRLLADDLYRARLVVSLQSWFSNNIQQFEL